MRKLQIICMGFCLWWVSITPLCAALGGETERFLFDVPGLPARVVDYNSIRDDSLVDEEQPPPPRWMEVKDHSAYMRILLNNFRHSIVRIQGKEILYHETLLRKLKTRYENSSVDTDVLWDFYYHVKSWKEYYLGARNFTSMSGNAYKLALAGIRELMRRL